MAKKPARNRTESDQPLSREIRQAIADDGRTPYALAKAAGVDEAAIRRFLTRERSLSLESADRLASALGLTLVRKLRKPRKPIEA
jgi:transcriptional regulator with XRE-family HTH domain